MTEQNKTHGVLTDADIDYIYIAWGVVEPLAFARHIEAVVLAKVAPQSPDIATPVAPADERAAFNKAFENEQFSSTQNAAGEYPRFCPESAFDGWQARARLAVAPTSAQHPDDIAVDQFAVAMKIKLAEKRKQGYSGWDSSECDAEWLSKLLRQHVEKGDPLDVGNFAMMLYQRGEKISSKETLKKTIDWEDGFY